MDFSEKRELSKKLIPFYKSFLSSIANLEIEFKINECLKNSENLDLSSFFNALLGKNIKSIDLW
jgi:hypothetical protein